MHIFSYIWTPHYAQVSFKNATVEVVAGAGGPSTLEVDFGDGDLTWTEQRVVEYTLNRGAISGDTVREGDDVPVEVTMDAVFDYVQGTGTQALANALKGNGTWAGYSSSSDACEPHAVDLKVTYEPGCGQGSGESEVILFSDFRYESLEYSFQNGTLRVSGKCNIKEPAFTFNAASSA